MSINIYVGNLPYETGDEDLKSMFEAYGEVTSAKVISDQFTGRSRGFGFVEMSNKEEGLKAIGELDSREMKGRQLKVNEARPRGGSGRGGGRRDDGGSRW